MNRVWFDGLMSSEKLSLSAFDRGLTLGDGLFETLLVVNETPLWFENHISRLKLSAEELRITFPIEDIRTSMKEICAGSEGLHALRLTLTRGAAGRGLAAENRDCTYFATTQTFARSMLFEPIALGVSSVRRNEMSMTSRLKTLSYMDEIVAAREAVALGFDDALMLNTRGKVASATIGNVFLVFGKTLVTPSIDQGVLPGILRSEIISVAPQLGYHVEERSIAVSEVESADGLFVTNSLRFLRPSKLHALKDYGALIESLCATAKTQCGFDPRFL